jgi:hypothetical protein
LRIHAGGKNPFEEFGVIPEEWAPKEKLHAMQFMKETDSLYALICGDEDVDTLPTPVRYLATLLIAEPAARMDAINKLDLKSGLAMTIEDIQALDPNEATTVPDIDKMVSYLDNVLEETTSTTESMNTNLSSPAAEESDLRDPLSFLSTFMGKAFVPDCVGR